LGVRGHWRPGFGCWLGDNAAGRGGDEAENVDGTEGEAGDEESESVGAGVRWREEDAAVVEEGVGKGEVEGGEAFEDFVVAKGEAKPNTVATWTGGERLPTDALGINFVSQVEIPYIRYPLEVDKRIGV
jgi:hypothetical protein